jgi:carboxyl-terminal processing protease
MVSFSNICTVYVVFNFCVLMLQWQPCSSFGSSKLASVNGKKCFEKVAAVIIAGSSIFSTMMPSASAATEWTDRKRLIAETWRTVDSLYYDRTFNGRNWFDLRQKVIKADYSSDEAVYEALKDMLSELGDKYTRFLAPSQYQAIMGSAIGELTGVGCELLATDDGRVKIVHLEEEGPAFVSGIQPGDLIIDVDGTPTKGLSPEEVALLLRGKPGTKASILISRENRKDIPLKKDFSVIRRKFKLKGVTSSRSSINSKDTGLITVRSFSSTTRDDVMHALEAFDAEADHRVQVLVLDLRNNGGGLLQGGVETANLFLAPGKIVVYVVDKDGRTTVEQTLTNGVPSGDINLPDQRTPLYVLVNGNTASAAEVLSAALKENDRAILVGEKTFGKGVIQTLSEVKGGAGVAVTIAKYETPLHNNINKVGIPVDKEVECSALDSTEDCAKKFI